MEGPQNPWSTSAPSGPESYTEVVRDPDAIRRKMLQMMGAARSEILLLLPTQAAFRREEATGAIELLHAAARRGLCVRVVSPSDSGIRTSIARINESLQEAGLKPVVFVEASQARAQRAVTLLVVDKKASLVIEQRNPSETEFIRAIGLATFSTSEPTVRASESIFERVSEETSLRMREEASLERERKNKRRAELLQDILAHDLRNYDQIILTNAELLKDTAPGASSENLDAIIRAARGSGDLVERAIKLSKIVAGGRPKLFPISLEMSFGRALTLLMNANPARRITVSAPLAPGNWVIADELLDEVFVNIVSNAVKHCHSESVPLEVTVERGFQRGGRSGERRLSVSISDHGPGIPDAMKRGLFTRHFGSASGSGLGLSIVYALVVERYGGEVTIMDRLRGEKGSGTKVRVTLNEAGARAE